ncbi:hypothetical protein [Mesorhizobium sp. GbtcB19]|uniref:hypothetical protein n=1 Tax=Mesorhizobium sp. GbtcB19 TaxID=2824764 RepID=UPI001C302330|nr:hypothetical protein [Mesorhizobium sp. GbtcB19]
MLSRNEANAMMTALSRDIAKLDAELFERLVRSSKHFGFLADEIVDKAIQDGTVIRDVDRAASEQEILAKLEDLEEDLEKAQAKIDELRDKLGYQADGLDRLQQAIVRREVDEAIDLLREIFPKHQFLSAAAEHMLAGIHGQGSLAL